MPTTANAIRRAAEILRAEAESLRECHAPRDDWTGEAEAQADHDEWIALADQLEALTAAPPAPVAAGWIRVEDRLPVLPDDHEDDGRPVWTWDGQFVAEDEFVPTYEQPAGPTVGGWVRTGEWFASDTPSRVTHWMPRVAPLPPSPEAEVSHD